jgi:hypothetical protein
MQGSLICLVAEGEEGWVELAFATVIQREDGLLDDPRGPFLDIQEVVSNTRGPSLDLSKTYTLVESATYWEPFRRVLEALLTIPNDVTGLPFPSVLIGAPDALDVAMSPPRYLLAQGHLGQGGGARGFTMPLPAGSPGAGSRVVDVVGSAEWPAWVAHDFCLNASQVAAVRLALSRQVAIVQGPPICGKTYVGVLVSRLLLHNSHLLRGRPLLFVCFTNHALDQLLEHISEYTDEIVRVGGRSKSKNSSASRSTSGARRSATRSGSSEAPGA